MTEMVAPSSPHRQSGVPALPARSWVRQISARARLSPANLTAGITRSESDMWVFNKCEWNVPMLFCILLTKEMKSAVKFNPDKTIPGKFEQKVDPTSPISACSAADSQVVLPAMLLPNNRPLRVDSSQVRQETTTEKPESCYRKRVIR